MFSFRRREPAQSLGTEYLDTLYRYALVLSRDRSMAEDLVQETYVRALEAQDRLYANSNVKGWLFTILRNLWFNELRRRRNQPQQVESEDGIQEVEMLPSASPTAHALLEQQESTSRVRAAIAQLPQEFQEVLLLREYEDLSYRDMAAVLKCPTGTVMSRLSRARMNLRSLLVKAEEEAFSLGQRR